MRIIVILSIYLHLASNVFGVCLDSMRLDTNRTVKDFKTESKKNRVKIISPDKCISEQKINVYCAGRLNSESTSTQTRIKTDTKQESENLESKDSKALLYEWIFNVFSILLKAIVDVRWAFVVLLVIMMGRNLDPKILSGIADYFKSRPWSVKIPGVGGISFGNASADEVKAQEHYKPQSEAAENQPMGETAPSKEGDHDEKIRKIIERPYSKKILRTLFLETVKRDRSFKERFTFNVFFDPDMAEFAACISLLMGVNFIAKVMVNGNYQFVLTDDGVKYLFRNLDTIDLPGKTFFEQ